MANTSVVCDSKTHSRRPAVQNGEPASETSTDSGNQGTKKVHAFHQLAPPTSDMCVVACDFSGKTLALARSCGTIEFWCLSHAAPYLSGRVTLPVALYPKTTYMQFYNKKRLFVTGASGFLLELCLLRSTVIRAIQCHIGSINSLSFCAKSAKVVVASETGAVSLFKTGSSTVGGVVDDELEFEKLLVQLSQPVKCVAIRDRLVAAGGRGKIWVWSINDDSTSRLLYEINAATAGETRCTVLAIAFADAETLVTGDSKGGTCFWDLRTGVLRNGIYAHQDAVTCVRPMQFSAGDTCVFSSGMHPFLIEFRKARTDQQPNTPLSANGQIDLGAAVKWVRTLKLKSTQTRHVRCLAQANDFLVAAGEGATVTLSSSQITKKLHPLTPSSAVHFAFDKLPLISTTGASPQYCYIMGSDAEILCIWRFRILLTRTNALTYSNDSHSSHSTFMHTELLVAPAEDDSSMSNSSSHTTTTSSDSTTITTSDIVLSRSRGRSRSSLACTKLLEYKIRSKNGPLTATALSDSAGFVAFADCKQLKIFKLNVIDDDKNESGSKDEKAIVSRASSSRIDDKTVPEVYLMPVVFDQQHAVAKRLAGSTAMCFLSDLPPSLAGDSNKRRYDSGLVVADKTGALVWLRLRGSVHDADGVSATIIWSSTRRSAEREGVEDGNADDNDEQALLTEQHQQNSAGIRQVLVTADRQFIMALTFESRLLVFNLNSSGTSVSESSRWDKRQKSDPFVTFTVTASALYPQYYYAFIACASRQLSLLDLQSRTIVMFFDNSTIYDGLSSGDNNNNHRKLANNTSTDRTTTNYMWNRNKLTTAETTSDELHRRHNDLYSCVRRIDCRSGRRVIWSTVEKIFMVDVDWRAVARRTKKRALANDNDDDGGDTAEKTDDRKHDDEPNNGDEKLWNNMQINDSYKYVVGVQELAVPLSSVLATASKTGMVNGDASMLAYNSKVDDCELVVVEQTPSMIEANLPSAYGLKKFGL